MKKSIKELKSIHILSLLGLVFIISACGGGGGGSSSTPVPTKPSDLKCPATIGDDFADYKAIDNYYDLKFYLVDTTGAYYDNKTTSKYCLTSDITIGSDFTTIDRFLGIFNGQGKAINNLKRAFIRLFSGNLNRVTFNQPVIKSVLSTPLLTNVAAIVTDNSGTIEKIKVNNPDITGDRASALIGYNTGTVKNSQVTGGKVTATITSYAAGLVALNKATVGPYVKVTGMTITSGYHSGGLVAYNTGSTIISGQVTSTKLTGVDVGGIVAGSYQGTINNNCASELSINASSERAGYILGNIVKIGNAVDPTFSNNQFKPTSITDGTPDHWGVGSATAATSGITIRDASCDDLAIDFN